MKGTLNSSGQSLLQFFKDEVKKTGICNNDFPIQTL